MLCSLYWESYHGTLGIKASRKIGYLTRAMSSISHSQQNRSLRIPPGEDHKSERNKKLVTEFQNHSQWWLFGKLFVDFCLFSKVFGEIGCSCFAFAILYIFCLSLFVSPSLALSSFLSFFRLLVITRPLVAPGSPRSSNARWNIVSLVVFPENQYIMEIQLHFLGMNYSWKNKVLCKLSLNVIWMGAHVIFV